MIQKILEDKGLVFSDERLKLVHHVLTAGEAIARHDHPEADVFFTVVKGHMQMLIDEKNSYEVKPGQVLHFDGCQTIEGKAIEDSEIFVYLLTK